MEQKAMDNINTSLDEAAKIAAKVILENETAPARQLTDTADAQEREIPKRTPATIYGESALTSRGYSFARVALAACTGDWRNAKVEVDIHRMLTENGMSPQSDKGILVPLNAEFLERHDSTRHLFGGWLQKLLTKEYKPSYRIARELVKVRAPLQQGTPSTGGFLVDAAVAPDFIELLRDNTVVEKAGARVITFPKSGQLIFKRQAGGATAYWVGEGQQLTESNATFGQMTLQEKYLGVYVRSSNQLIQHATPDVETLIREDMAVAVALAQDLAFLRGTGSTVSPQGILNTTGVNIKYITSDGSGSGNGRAIKAEDLIEMRGIVRKAMKRQHNALAFVFNTDLETMLLKMRVDALSAGDSAGAFLFGGGLREVDPDKLLQVPYFISDQLPSNLTFGNKSTCTEVYLGDFGEAIIARGAVAEVVPNQAAETAYLNNETWFRLILGVDFGLRHPEAFCVGRGAVV